MANLGNIGTGSGDAKIAVSAITPSGVAFVPPAVVDIYVGLELPAPVVVVGGTGAGSATLTSAAPTATMTRVQ